MEEGQSEAQEAFLDICMYFHGWEWNVVSQIVGRENLEALQARMLVTRTDSDCVIVHDILRVMGMKEAKGSRITNFEQLYLHLGDVAEFPFKDASKLEKLTVFKNASKSGLDLSK
ncbi:hypothetical protein KI387_039078, partial [Taxus chinensis]